MKHLLIVALWGLGLAGLGAGCATVPQSAAERDSSHDAVDNTIRLALEKDAGLKHWFDTSFGYAVFPTVGKGGMGIGGAYGKGEVFQKGQRIGYASLTQATFGFQFGGQAYTEFIFFKDKTALESFTSGNFEFSAQASVAAITVGASADADYSGGVAVFTLAKGGLMYEASIGGQKFDFRDEPTD